MSGQSVTRQLEWCVGWYDGDYHRRRITTDIEEAKRIYQGLQSAAQVGVVSSLCIHQRWAAVNATEWVKPTWV